MRKRGIRANVVHPPILLESSDTRLLGSGGTIRLDSMVTSGYIVPGSPVINASLSTLEAQWNNLNARGMCRAGLFEMISESLIVSGDGRMLDPLSHELHLPPDEDYASKTLTLSIQVRYVCTSIVVPRAFYWCVCKSMRPSSESPLSFLDDIFCSTERS